jgi:hypothetical protein
MTFGKAYPLSSGNHAVIGQPVYLVVVLIITATTITIAGLSLSTIMRDGRIHEVECQIEPILTESSLMFEYADEGSIVHMRVEFPTSLRFIVFGSLPRNGTKEPTNHTLDENNSNNYYFVMNDGTLRTFHSNARFSDRNTTQIVVLHPGRYNLTMELMKNEGKTYVTLY